MVKIIERNEFGIKKPNNRLCLVCRKYILLRNLKNIVNNTMAKLKITAETWEWYKDHPEKQKQGIHIYYQGIPYPRRLYWDRLNDPNFTLRALNALGVVKKYLFSLVYILDFAVPRTLSVKKYDTFLRRILSFCEWTLDEFIQLKDDEWSLPVWELGKFTRQFLEAFGLSVDVSLGYSKIVMCILEFDNAYRYRIQDLFGAVSITWWLLNPSKWMKLGLEEYKKREGLPGAAQKINKIGWMLVWILKIPKFKKAWIKATEGVVYRDILFDDNDRFHFSFWRGYDYEGKTFEQRFTPYEEIIRKAPFKKKINPEDTAKFLLGD